MGGTGPGRQVGVLLTVVGLVGGNVRAVIRLRGVRPGIVRRATELREAAGLVDQDYRRAVEAVRREWAPLERELGELRGLMGRGRPGGRGTALLVALRVLVDAGPRARAVAGAGRELAGRLDPLLSDAAVAAGPAHTLDAGRERRREAAAAVAGLRRVLDVAERDGVVREFAQVSVDLPRGADRDPDGLAAWVDFEARPAEYSGRLAEVVIVDRRARALGRLRRLGAVGCDRLRGVGGGAVRRRPV